MDATPEIRWKLMEHEGWQILVTIDEKDDEDGWDVKISLGVREFDAAITIGSPKEGVARTIFDGVTDPAKAYAVLKDHSGGLLP